MMRKCFQQRGSFTKFVLTNVAPVVLAGALLVTAVDIRSFIPGEVQASTSLPGIESVKTTLRNGEAFNILEVTPKSTTEVGAPAMGGDFGYLIAGQEPVNLQKTLPQVAKYDENDISIGSSAHDQRTQYANNLLKGLVNAHIASTVKDSAPLKISKAGDDSYYRELWPWEPDEDGEQTFTLNSEETISLTNVTEEYTEGGSFSALSSSYIIAPTDSNGQYTGKYVQNITSENPMTQASGVFTADDFNTEKSGYIFYRLSIKKMTPDEILADKSALSRPVFSKYPDTDEEKYSWELDNLASERHTFDSNKEYATGEIAEVSYGSGIESYDDLTDEWFVSRILDSNPYRQVTEGETGYFTTNKYTFEYVGSGNGNYNLTVDPDNITRDANAAKYVIQYKTVRYIGGYTNNNWFLRYVLDFDGESEDTIAKYASSLRVDYVKPEDVRAEKNTDAGQNMNFAGYRLVVLGRGLDLSGDTVKYGADNAYNNISSSGELATSLEAYLRQKMPVIAGQSAASNTAFGGRNGNPLYNDTGNKSVISEAIAGSNYGAAQTSIYVFRTNDNYPVMSSDSFITSFPSGQFNVKTAPFYVVYNEIAYENTLRRTQNPGTEDLIDETRIGEAETIRYIINYRNHRDTSRKESIRVLDIEPEDTGALSSDHNSILSSKLVNWLGGEYTTAQIQITTIATRTLNGQLDDIAENYDLVYIGTDGKWDNYVDKDMEGLVYYNIGDLYYKTNHNTDLDKYMVTAGMKDSDYTGNTAETYNNEEHYRYSGNDLTSTKAGELKEFIKEGFPVILDDSLISGAGHDKFSFDIEPQVAIPSYNLEGQPGLRASLNFTNINGDSSMTAVHLQSMVTCKYRWYKMGYGWNSSANKNSYINETEVSGATTDFCPLPNGYDNGLDYYRYEITSVTIDGKTTKFDDGKEPASGVIHVTNSTPNGSFLDQNYGNSKYYQWGHSNDDNYSVGVTVSGSNNGSILTANRSVDRDWDSNVTFKWVKEDQSKTIDGAMTSLADWQNGDKIQAVMTNGSNYAAASNYYTVNKTEFTEQVTGDKIVENQTGSVDVNASNNSVINLDTIDAYTNLYDTLNECSGYSNLMSATTADASGPSIVNMANLSSPQIQYVNAPAQYTESSENKLTNRELTFTFRILNKTDVEPKKTTYTAHFYIDANSDGVVSDGEELTSIVIKQMDGSTSSEVPNDGLKGGVSEDNAAVYVFSATVPTSLKGAFSWKFQIRKNAGEGTDESAAMPSTSKTGVSYVGFSDNQPVKVRVLQLNSDINYSGDNRYKLNRYVKLYKNNENSKYLFDQNQHIDNDLSKGIKSGAKPRDYRSDDPNGNSLKTTTNTEIVSYDLEALKAYDAANSSQTSDQFGKWLNDETHVTNRYDIEIRTIRASNASVFFRNNPDWKDNYDMVFMGFGDSYSCIPRDAIYDIRDFADMGKSVLCAHDNSSHGNVNSESEDGRKLLKKYTIHHDLGVVKGDAKLRYVWGAYDFNTLMRSRSYMDVYGISDITTYDGSYRFGGTSHWEISETKGGTNITSGVLASDSDLSPSYRQELRAQNYSIAYKPKSGQKRQDLDTAPIVHETQGYSDDGILKNYGKDGYSGGGRRVMGYDNHAMITKKVTQVNKGQITSYPYDINVGRFADQQVRQNQNTISVTDTHAQWYQLNMNADNIAVWFTVDGGIGGASSISGLEGDREKKSNNYYRQTDCINNYYIYNAGNITYTGAGHADKSDTVTEDEAKLFVNTMIAALRISNSAPTADYVKNARNKTKTDSLEITGMVKDISSNKATDIKAAELEARTSALAKAKAYFVIKDNNLSSVKKLSVDFYDRKSVKSVAEFEDGKTVEKYKLKDSPTTLTISQIYDANDDTLVTNGYLKSNKVYYIYLPNEIYNKLLTENSTELFMQPKLTVGKKAYAQDYLTRLKISIQTKNLFTLG